jgi:hypothetical protein
MPRLSVFPSLLSASLLSVSLLLSSGALRAVADDAPSGPLQPPPQQQPPACAAPPQRLAALEHEIRHLERHLQVLRRARADVVAGRPESFPPDAAAIRAAEASQRTLRDIQRYEAARSRALAQLSRACTDNDGTKATEVRAALASLDEGFVAEMAQDDAKPPPKGSPQAPEAGPKGDGAPSPEEPKNGPEKKPRGKRAKPGAMDGESSDDDAGR